MLSLFASSNFTVFVLSSLPTIDGAIFKQFETGLIKIIWNYFIKINFFKFCEIICWDVIQIIIQILLNILIKIALILSEKLY